MAVLTINSPPSSASSAITALSSLGESDEPPWNHHCANLIFPSIDQSIDGERETKRAPPWSLCVTAAATRCPRILMGTKFITGFTLLGPNSTMGFTLLGPKKVVQHKKVSFPVVKYPDHAESPKKKNGSAASA